MQEITVNAMIDRAAELLNSGTVDRVLGWKKGEFFYDVTPAVFCSAEELRKDFVFNEFCGCNFSKYLVKETRKSESRVLVFLKPCDTYSFNQLLTEHRFEREKVYAVGIPCKGMLDIGCIRSKVGEGVTGIAVNGEILTVSTLYDGEKTISRMEALPDRCLRCKGKKHAAYDELIGEQTEEESLDRFEEVRMLEGMTAEQRYGFWQNELSRCIRCNACRDVCPACTCEKCVFDNPKSGVENKAASDSFEEKLFHIIRAFHVAGRCTDCGECSRVCPQHIPLHLLNRKFISDINEFYGEYQAGETVGSRSPLVDYTKDDIEVMDAVRRGEVD